MVRWLLKRLFHRALTSQRAHLSLAGMEHLARLGDAGWLLAQERARLDFLAAKEAFCQGGSWAEFRRVLDTWLQLGCTNAVVQSLLNEQALERRLAAGGRDGPGRESPELRKRA
jgi:hypothetical protein